MSWLDHDLVDVALKMGYLALIPGILASGMVITLDSWARTYRRRTIGNIGRTAWNTYAQIHNTYNAIGDIDTAFGSVVDSLKGSGSSSESSDKKDGAAAFIVADDGARSAAAAPDTARASPTGTRRSA